MSVFNLQQPLSDSFREISIRPKETKSAMEDESTVVTGNAIRQTGSKNH
jgi:hypothetical protein